MSYENIWNIKFPEHKNIWNKKFADHIRIMSIHKEDDTIVTFDSKSVETIHKVCLDGSLEKLDIPFKKLKSFTGYPPGINFYIHSGQEEFISYNTVTPDGRVLEVNRFLAVNKNPGIKRNNGTRG